MVQSEIETVWNLKDMLLILPGLAGLAAFIWNICSLFWNKLKSHFSTIVNVSAARFGALKLSGEVYIDIKLEIVIYNRYRETRTIDDISVNRKSLSIYHKPSNLTENQIVMQSGSKASIKVSIIGPENYPKTSFFKLSVIDNFGRKHKTRRISIIELEKAYNKYVTVMKEHDRNKNLKIADFFETREAPKTFQEHAAYM